VDFISKLLKEKKYKKALKEVISLVNKSSNEFSKKISLWNKYGKDVIKNSKTIKELRKPIEL